MDDYNPTGTDDDTRRQARPIRFVKDREGNRWLCDHDVDPNEDLQAQGCWRYGETPFSTGGRKPDARTH